MEEDIFQDNSTLGVQDQSFIINDSSTKSLIYKERYDLGTASGVPH
jgi:hypothetical protein